MFLSEWQPAGDNVDGQEVDIADKVEPVNDNFDQNRVHEGWGSNKWKQGDYKMTWLPEFTWDKSFLTEIPNDADNFFFFFLSDWGYFRKPCKWNKQVCRNFSPKEERYFPTTFNVQTINRMAFHWKIWKYSLP